MLVEYLADRMQMTHKDVRRVLAVGLFATFGLGILWMEHASSRLGVSAEQKLQEQPLNGISSLMLPREQELRSVMENSDSTILFFSVNRDPLTLTWQVHPSLQDNYEVEICERGGFRCAKYFDVQCETQEGCQVLDRKSYKLTESYIREHQVSDTLNREQMNSDARKVKGMKSFVFVDQLMPKLQSDSYLRIRSYSDSSIGKWKSGKDI